MPTSYKMWQKPITKTKQTPEISQIRDTFQTPKYAVDLLVPYIPQEIKFIWEPACGDGKIISALYREKSRPWVCYASDIRESTVRPHNIMNFLDDLVPMLFDKENWAIITNPPFSIKNLFIEKAFEHGVPFAFLINADYSGQQIEWIERGCEKIIPKRRINYITPNVVARINLGESTGYKSVDEIPSKLLYNYSSSQFHSIWLTYGFGLGKTETFVDMPISYMKENMI